MAGKGPPPKERRSRPRDTRDFEVIDGGKAPTTAAGKPKELRIERADPVTGRPAFPKSYRLADDEVEYLPVTRERWRAWCKDPVTSTFGPTDWYTLLDTAPLWDQYARTGSRELLPEMRLREAKLGATREDRLRLGIKRASENRRSQAQRARSRTMADPRRQA